jgi:hypothetical protein
MVMKLHICFESRKQEVHQKQPNLSWLQMAGRSPLILVIATVVTFLAYSIILIRLIIAMVVMVMAVMTDDRKQRRSSHDRSEQRR